MRHETRDSLHRWRGTGNPGPAAIGIVLTDAQGKEIEALGEAIGSATNNEAEYRALLRGLEHAAAHGAEEIVIRSDSELLARQLNGAYRVRAENLKALHAQAQRALAHFKRVSVQHIPREKNARADALANGALDGRPPTTARRPLLVIVTGAPCAGKTTLARRIAREFQLPLVTKDDIKESLFETLGWKDREWSKKLGRATMELLFYFAESQLAAGRSLIVESNFHKDLATERFRALRDKFACVPLQIVLQADGAVLTQRYRSRSQAGTRHPGHVDDLMPDDELATVLARDYGTMEIGGETLEIDTSDFGKVDCAALLAAIENRLEALGLKATR